MVSPNTVFPTPRLLTKGPGIRVFRQAHASKFTCFFRPLHYSLSTRVLLLSTPRLVMVKLNIYGRGRPLRMAIMFTCQLAFILFGMYIAAFRPGKKYYGWRRSGWYIPWIADTDIEHSRIRPGSILWNRRQR